MREKSECRSTTRRRCNGHFRCNAFVGIEKRGRGEESRSMEGWVGGTISMSATIPIAFGPERTVDIGKHQGKHAATQLQPCRAGSNMEPTLGLSLRLPGAPAKARIQTAHGPQSEWLLRALFPPCRLTSLVSGHQVAHTGMLAPSI